MQIDLQIILLAPTAQHILGHTPVGTFYKYRHAVDIDVEGIVVLVIGVLAYAKGNLLRLRNSIVYLHLKTAAIQIGLAISVRPPQAGIVDAKLREITLVEPERAHGIAVELYLLRKNDISGSDCTRNNRTNLLGRVVAHIERNGELGTRPRRERGANPRVNQRNPPRIGKIYLIGNTAIETGHIGHPVPAAATQIGRAAVVGQRRLRNVYQDRQHVHAVAFHLTGNIETATVHKTVECAQQLPVEVNIGLAVYAVEIEPHILLVKILRHGKLGPIPETAVVLGTVYPRNVIAEIGVFFQTRGYIRGKYSAGNYGIDPRRNIKTGRHDGRRVGYIVLRSYFPHDRLITMQIGRSGQSRKGQTYSHTGYHILFHLSLGIYFYTIIFFIVSPPRWFRRHKLCLQCNAHPTAAATQWPHNRLQRPATPSCHRSHI